MVCCKQGIVVVFLNHRFKKIVTLLSCMVFKIGIFKFTCKGEKMFVVLLREHFGIGFFGITLRSGLVINMRYIKRNVLF